jgi:protein-disulfide isomerase
MKRPVYSLLATVASVALFSAFSTTAVSAQEKPLTKVEVENIVKQVISDNPELLMKSVENYRIKMQAQQAVEMQKSIASLQDDFKKDVTAPVAGNPRGSVTVVEFFDYHCGYCKHMLPVVTQLLEEDKDVRFIFKELPILSEDSTLAAKAALGVYKVAPKKYFEYHSALMKLSGTFTEQQLLDTAKSIGVNSDQVKQAMNSAEVQKELDQNREIATRIGINGTPAMIIGKQLLPGAVKIEELKKRIADERAGKR